jgi:hypothetical protein
LFTGSAKNRLLLTCGPADMSRLRVLSVLVSSGDRAARRSRAREWKMRQFGELDAVIMERLRERGYEPTGSRSGYTAALMSEALDTSTGRRTALAHFVLQMSPHDAALLQQARPGAGPVTVAAGPGHRGARG